MSEGSRGSRVSDYDYALPPERIARYPAERRDESRLLVVPRQRGAFEHLRFRDLPELIAPGDVLVLNESRVLKARLLGQKPSGAPAEVLLLHPLSGEGGRRWAALVRPGGKLKPGRSVVVADDLTVEIVDSTDDGGRVVELRTPLSPEDAIERHGHLPLPPYLEREAEALDLERYQTVYAGVPGSVAAPTAGLHFTDPLLERVRGRGAHIAKVVLHVGVGTFRPVEEEDPSLHRMHSERWSVPEATAALLAEARSRGARIWAVGTTVARTLETAADAQGRVVAGTGETELFIRPPFPFRVVDVLITNFHLPRSTLMMLVAAFAGFDQTHAAYAEAVGSGYRFYSYGDAMVLL